MPGMPGGGNDSVERRMMVLERRMEALMYAMDVLTIELKKRGLGPNDNPLDTRPGAAPGDRKPVPAPPPPGDDGRRPARGDDQPPPVERPKTR